VVLVADRRPAAPTDKGERTIAPLGTRWTKLIVHVGDRPLEAITPAAQEPL